MFDSITKMISPAKGIQLLKMGIENQIQKKIKTFDLIFVSDKDQILFNVVLPNNERVSGEYNHSNKAMLMFVIKTTCKMKFKNNEQLDIIKCAYHEDETIDLDVFMTIDGKKEKINFLNYKP